MSKIRKLENNENETVPEYPGESTIGDQSSRGGPAVAIGPRALQKIKTAESEPMVHKRIARKAYELYERRGCEPGRDAEDWLEAQRLVRGEIQVESDRKKTRRHKARRRGEP
jgi:hypothetical protein